MKTQSEKSGLGTTPDSEKIVIWKTGVVCPPRVPRFFSDHLSTCFGDNALHQLSFFIAIASAVAHVGFEESKLFPLTQVSSEASIDLSQIFDPATFAYEEAFSDALKINKAERHFGCPAVLACENIVGLQIIVINFFSCSDLKDKASFLNKACLMPRPSLPDR